MPPMAERGIVYAACLDQRYLEEVVLSAITAKREAPALPITLFTDLPDHPLCRIGLFDDVVEHSVSPKVTQPWSRGLLFKVKAINASPYEETLFLDTDTRIEPSGLDGLFEFLETAEIAMVECHPEESIGASRVKHGMYNSGVMLFRRTSSINTLLETWEQRTIELFELAEKDPLPPYAPLSHLTDDHERRSIMQMDQTSLAELLTPQINVLNVDVLTLPYQWNDRGSPALRKTSGPTRIHHNHLFKARTTKDLLVAAEHFNDIGALAKGSAFASHIARRLGMEHLVEEQQTSEQEASRQARIHLQAGSYETAESICARALKSDPQNLHAQATKALLAASKGLLEDAHAIMEQCLRLDDQDPWVQEACGYLRFAQGNTIDSIAWLKRAEKRQPSAVINFEIGNGYLKLEDFGKAEKHFRKTLKRRPDHRSAQINHLFTLLGIGAYRKALATCEARLDKEKGSTAELAVKYVCHQQLPRLRKKSDFLSSDLLDVSELRDHVQDVDFVAFNKTVGQSIVRECSKRPAFGDHTTMNGQQSVPLSHTNEKHIKKLNAYIAEAVSRKLDTADPNHWFWRSKPTVYEVKTWGLALGEDGYQAPHFHPDAYLSGVYFVGVPESVINDQVNHNGWLVFGRPEDKWLQKSADIVEQHVMPEEGKLVMFPSYLWHGTIPLNDPGPRISFAFDVIPH